MKHKFLIIVCLLVCTVAYCATDLHLVSFEVTVKDEYGNPIEDAKVVVFALQKAHWEDRESSKTEGKTDSNGEFRSLEKTISSITFGVEKSGYYEKDLERISYSEEVARQGKVLETPITIKQEVVLKKIFNPVVLRKGKGSIFFGESNEKVGFDLDVGDVVSSTGKGKKSSFFIERKGVVTGYDDYDCQLVFSFPNKGDGIFPFNIKKDEWRFAPEIGYEGEKEFTIRWHDGKANSYKNDLGSSCFIRINTVLDEEGKVVSANYMRLRKISFRPKMGDDDNRSRLEFVYEMNPEINNRSLEWKNVTVDLSDWKY